MPRLRPLIALATALVLLLGLTTAAASASPLPARAFLLHLTGAQEAVAMPPCSPPAVCGDPDASARMVLVVVPRVDKICFATSWRSIDGTVTAAHIHPGAVGVPGPVAVPLFSGTFQGTDRTHGCVSANGLADEIVANPSGYYVNIHSTVYPAGAVRDQVG